MAGTGKTSTQQGNLKHPRGAITLGGTSQPPLLASLKELNLLVRFRFRDRERLSLAGDWSLAASSQRSLLPPSVWLKSTRLLSPTASAHRGMLTPGKPCGLYCPFWKLRTGIVSAFQGLTQEKSYHLSARLLVLAVSLSVTGRVSCGRWWMWGALRKLWARGWAVSWQSLPLPWLVSTWLLASVGLSRPWESHVCWRRIPALKSMWFLNSNDEKCPFQIERSDQCGQLLGSRQTPNSTDKGVLKHF